MGTSGPETISQDQIDDHIKKTGKLIDRYYWEYKAAYGYSFTKKRAREAVLGKKLDEYWEGRFKPWS